MKRLLALLLTLALMLATSAFAEGETYLRQLPQYNYVNTALLTEESYPEVCLSPYYPFRYFGSNAAEPLFLCFPSPAGAAADSFSSMSASYLDVDNGIQYSYEVDESNSFEEFINKADKDEWILMDGSDGAAAVIFPDSRRARAMIATKEFGKSSKLRIGIVLDNLSSRMPEETRVTALTDAILAEVERVRGAMRYETRAPYWSAGKYAGAKLLSYDDFDYMLKVDFPTLTCATADKGDLQADMILTGMRYSKSIEGVYSFAENTYLEVELEFSDYSYPVYQLSEKDEAALEMQGSDGRTWYVYLNWYDDRAIAGYASALLDYGQNHDEQRYLTVHLSGSGSGIHWTSNEDFLADAEMFAFSEMKAADDPYVPAEKPAPAEEAKAEEVSKSSEEGPAEEGAPAEENAWTCPNCGETNTGKFCHECGTPRPVEGEWTCPSCGTVNTGKFCTECGSPRPE